MADTGNEVVLHQAAGASLGAMPSGSKKKHWRWPAIFIAAAFLLVVLSSVVARSGSVSVRKVTAIRFDPTLMGRLAKAEMTGLCVRPKQERIGLPAEVLPSKSGVDARTNVPPDLVADLAAAIGGLPAPIASAFERYVCSVVLITGLGATGMTVKLEREPARSVILLNVDNLDRSANAWVSFKESSFFGTADGLAIVGKLAAQEDGNRRVLLGYLITHELGHVLKDALPKDPRIAAFDRTCWPRRDAFKDFSLRPYAAAQGAEPLHEINLEPLYDFIAASCFPSLTAAMNPGEDFADSLALYSHSVLLGRPWQVSAYRNGELSRRLKSCWSDARCQRKRQALERLLVGFRTP